MAEVPVLIVAFNRPDLMVRLIDRLREVAPRRVFVAVDGPRPDRPGERERVEHARTLVSAIDWPCEVRTNFRESNLGCARGVSGAITWFFEAVDRGIILEDDIIPDPTFFPFTQELLDRFANDERVMAISGSNFVPPGRIGVESSYRFATIPHVWGWATWRRVWRHFQLDLNDWREGWPAQDRWRATGWSAGGYLRWRDHFDSVGRGKVDSWAYPLTHLALRRGWITATSNVNLTDNIGFDLEATHTLRRPSYLRGLEPMRFPLVHPKVIEPDEISDEWTRKAVFEATASRYLRSVGGRVLREVLDAARGGDPATADPASKRAPRNGEGLHL